jgi:flagellar hook assembly protein FlgD
MQNYPNPFNPDTNIFYQLATPQHISVAIYDLSGKNVRTIKKGLEWSGTHVTRWDGTDDVGHQVSSGAYFARLTSEAGSSTIRMILIR